MEGDLSIFFAIFAVIFLLGLFSFFISNKISGKPWGYSPPRKRLGEALPYKVNEDKICKLYGFSEDEIEIKGCVELLEKEFLFKDLDGYTVLKIPYGQIINCAVRFPGDNLGSRPLWRLMLPGWWRLPIPILAKRNYLTVLYKTNKSEETLSFTFNDKTETFMYLKDVYKNIKEKIEKLK